VERDVVLTAPIEMSDERIVQRVLQGETALFEVIMRRHNQRLYRLARAMLRDPHDAEDALQETYVRAYRNLGQFEARSRLSTWLMHIAVNECRARLRRRRRDSARKVPMIRADLTADPDAPRPAERIASAELGELITRAVEALPRQVRAVFVLREVEGMDTASTAESLGLTPANVKVRLHRARRQLQQSLETSLGVEARQLYAFDGERCDRIISKVLARITAEGCTPYRHGQGTAAAAS
jgi:RNA polymerase sigma-70 factor (ECF subfamily)